MCRYVLDTFMPEDFRCDELWLFTLPPRMSQLDIIALLMDKVSSSFLSLAIILYSFSLNPVREILRCDSHIMTMRANSIIYFRAKVS